MAFENLPGVRSVKVDGNLLVNTPNNNPIVLVLGTSDSGPAEDYFRVSRATDAAKTFGKGGTLVRGMYEVIQGGASNVRLYRLGAKAASLTLPLGASGADVTFTTIEKDATIGDDYTMLYDGTSGQLTIRRVLDNEIVLFIDPSDPDAKVDLNEISVDGDVASGNTDVETAAAEAVVFSAVATEGDAGAAYAGATFTAGDDGTDLSRMELYENLYNAYELLRDQEFDQVVPMDVYLDDANVMDETGDTVSGLWFGDATNTYPTPGGQKDMLGKVYVEEYEGENRFWWLLHWDRTETDADPAADLSALTAPVVLYPSGVGSATATTKTDGTALSFDDFHEVNFAYQLANFCFQTSQTDQECTGYVGTKAPNSYSLKDLSEWAGKLPVYDDENDVITTNGTGLLGNKFMSGRLSSGSGNSKIPGHVVDGLDGRKNGGFIGTEDGWLDTVQLKDNNDRLVDIGKYLSVLSAQPILSNPVLQSYVSSAAGVYAGFVSTLPANSAPTNKVVPGVGLPFRLNLEKVNQLAGQRFVHFHAKPKGVVVSDAPSATRPDSDYNRLSTMRIVKACIDAVRDVSDPFLGEGLTGARMAALETAIERVLVQLQQAQFIQRFEKVVSATPDQQVLGQATVELTLVPAFELRQITVVVSLARQ